jgi:hypothetical protein
MPIKDNYVPIMMQCTMQMKDYVCTNYSFFCADIYSLQHPACWGSAFWSWSPAFGCWHEDSPAAWLALWLPGWLSWTQSSQGTREQSISCQLGSEVSQAPNISAHLKE